MKRLISFIFFITCLLVYGSSVAAFKNVKLGENAPKFKLNEIDSEESFALDDYIGKNNVIILLFWSTWSPRSQKELGDLKEMLEKYGDKGVDVIAINVEKEEPLPEEFAKMKEIKETIQPGFKMLLDSGLNMFHEYGVVAVPSTVILDSTGSIQKIYDGYPTSAKLDIATDIEIMLGIREPEEEEVKVAAKGPKILKAAKLHYGLGRKLIERGMGTKAVRELEKSAKLDKNYDLPLVLLGEVYEIEYKRVRTKTKKAKNLEKAADAFNRALKRNDENLFAFCGLARVYARLGKFNEADEAIKNAFKIDSNFITCVVANAILLQSKGNDEEAIKEFQKALEQNPNQPEVQYLMAKSYSNLEDYDNSIANFKKAFQQLVTKIQINMAQGH